MHSGGAFEGGTLARYAHVVVPLLRFHQCRSVLDYGCGKARAWEVNGELAAWKHANRVELFEPAIEAYHNLPDGTFDAVLMVDVLEHIPEDELHENIYRVNRKSEPYALLIATFCNRPATKNLPGTNINAHVTQRPRKWWREFLGDTLRKDIGLKLLETT